MANILITGANGQLGSELRKIGFSPLDEVFFTDVAELDITDYTAIEKFIQVHEVDTIINCAAYTAVDRAEDEPGPAAEINTQAVANLAKAAQKLAESWEAGCCISLRIMYSTVPQRHLIQRK